MDLQLFIAVNVIALAAMALLFTLVYRPHGYGGWAAAFLGCGAAGAAALVFAEPWAGWITLAVFVVLVVTPAVLFNLAARAGKAGKHDLARRLAWIGGVFHPSRATAFNFALVQAMTAGSSDRIIDALGALAPAARPAERAMLAAAAAAEQDDWASALAAARDPGASMFDIAPMTIRALGELGRVDEMADVYERVKTRLFGPNVAINQLFLFAFAGREDGIAHLLAGRLKALEPEAKSYWSAIARLTVDPADPAARAVLCAIAEGSPREKSRLAAARQLAITHRPLLSPETRAIVAKADAQLARERETRTRPLTRLYGTLGLVALTLGMFAVSEWWGGSEDLRVLVRLGAARLFEIVDEGQWWRILTTPLLHFGPVHLAANMLMLLVFGRLVESLHGTVRLLAVYVWCGAVSTAAVVGSMWLEATEPDVLIGASGAIFGLFGVAVARSVATWWRYRDALDRSQLVAFGLIVALQAVMDFLIPNVSFLAHASGFAAGLVAGAVLVALQRSDARAG